MVIILTASFVILGLGLLLLVLGLKGRSRPAIEAAPEIPVAGESNLDYSTAPPRRVRVVPLVLGVLLTLCGGAAVAAIFNEGLDSDRLDQVVMNYWPANSLVDELDHDVFPRRYNAARELQKRYEEDRLPDNVQQRLVNRQMARMTGEEDAPDAPAPGAPIVELDLIEMRKEGKLADAQWGKVIARTAPMRFDIPRRAAPGEPITLRMVLSLADPEAPAWVIVQVQDLKIEGQAVEPLPAVAVAPNPAWEPPPPVAAPAEPDPNAPPGPPPGPPPSRRVVRHDFQLPAELVAGLGTGSKQVSGRVVVYGFDPGTVEPPSELSDEATFLPRARGDAPDTEMVAAAFSAKLTAEQAAGLIARALGQWEYPVDRRIEIGDPPATRPTTPTTQPAEEGEAGEGEGDAQGGDGGEGE